MLDKNFTAFLENLKTRDNQKLMETIIGGFKNLFEGDGTEAAPEETAPEAESAPEEAAPEAESAPEEAAPEAEAAPEETAPEAAPEESGMAEASEVAPDVAPAPEKEATENPNQAFIDALNGDLSREYAAAIQYIQHAAVMTGAANMTIMKEMLVHADEEIAHAKTISDKINYLGGIPTADVGPIKVSNDPAEMIQQDKTGEEEAIQRYKERIKQADSLSDFSTKEILMEILSDEEEHRNDLMIALGQ